jgi:hypothetical protein
MILMITGCSETKKSLDSWLGDYSYSEPPVKSIAGYNMVMSWNLSVNKIDNFYKAILNVNGQQTAFSLVTDLKGNDSTLYLIYDQTLSGTEHNLKKDDTLFILSKSATRIKTKWKELSPILSDQPPKDCNCFAFTGVNKDNNTLQLPR